LQQVQQATSPNAHQTLILHGCDLNDLNRRGTDTIPFLFFEFLVSRLQPFLLFWCQILPIFGGKFFLGKFYITLVGMPMHDD
jgi:hypothetical protein